MKRKNEILKITRCQFHRTDRSNYIALAVFAILFVFCSLITAQDNPQIERLNYRIGVGDVLKVIVLKQQILSQDDVRVNNDGTIRLPMITENIPAICMTEAELSAEIAKRYKKYLLNPQIYVAVKEFNAYPVAVIGAVNTPGTFQLKSPTRLLKILSYVNGPSVNAGQNIQIIRDLKSKWCEQTSSNTTENSATESESNEEILLFSLKEVLRGGESANPFVEAGDIIRVTEAELKQAFIIGNVKTPTILNLKEPVTLSKAIAMAGGFSQGAKIDKIKISRQAEDSLAKTEILVNLKGKNNQEDILLQANDIIEVPGPKPPSRLRRILESIIPAVTRVPILIP
jgi:polysaccharide biosynthesis/export protein